MPSIPIGGEMGALLKLLEAASSLEALERMLLAWALHRHGLGLERAHLVLFDSGSDHLVAWTGGAADRGDAPLEEALHRAAITVPGPRAVTGTERGLSRMRWTAEELDGVAHLAWHGTGVAVACEAGIDADGPAREGAVVLVRDGTRHGMLVGGWEREGEARDLRARLERFGRVAECALSAFERREAARRGAGAAAMLAEMARTVASSHNVAEILYVATRLAATGTDAWGAAVWTVHGADGLRLDVLHGPAQAREEAARLLEPLAKRVCAENRARWIEPPVRDALPEGGDLTRLALLPVAAYGRVRGVLAVYDRTDRRPESAAGFGPRVRAFLESIADHMAVAIDQAERCDQQRVAVERDREATEERRRDARLAMLGESALEIAREARNPLASILAFARRAQGELGEDDPRREHLEIVVREAGRLEKLIGEGLNPVMAHAPRKRLEQPNELVQQALQRFGEALVRRRIRLTKKLGSEIPRLLVDPDRIREAFASLLEHAVASAAVGGRMRVETRRAASHVVIELAHDAPRHPGDALEQLFVPFASHGPASIGGLGMAHRILREHGGEIRARSEGEWSMIVGFTLPIHENQDRRKHAERRLANRDRRTPSAG